MEPVRLSSNVSPVRYDLTIIPDFALFTFKGIVEIKIRYIFGSRGLRLRQSGSLISAPPCFAHQTASQLRRRAFVCTRSNWPSTMFPSKATMRVWNTMLNCKRPRCTLPALSQQEVQISHLLPPSLPPSLPLSLPPSFSPSSSPRHPSSTTGTSTSIILPSIYSVETMKSFA